jgi:hypothetical protein
VPDWFGSRYFSMGFIVEIDLELVDLELVDLELVDWPALYFARMRGSIDIIDRLHRDIWASALSLDGLI